MTDLFWRENVSLANAVLQLCLAVVFLRLIWVQWKVCGWRSLWQDQVSQGAIALAVMNIGSSVYRIWIWLILRVFNDGNSPIWFKAQWPLVLVASVMVVAGSLCAIRVFSPDRWRHWGWIGAALLTGAAVAANILI